MSMMLGCKLAALSLFLYHIASTKLWETLGSDEFEEARVNHWKRLQCLGPEHRKVRLLSWAEFLSWRFAVVVAVTALL